ncbi:Imm71 family immunity protein [Dyella sp. ASV21]|uniref:Imm71 family immunity protein n=1 Tax=Dyella sp. ASV21 TaxID=2795114 RepID=UPI0018EBA8F9|nr:Imm71 family immunity protein [Dyella sp. ASV21]
MSTYPQGVMLPDDHERQQIFYWLKRISSYSAWNRILDYYRAWAAVSEKSVQAASERGLSAKTDVPESDLVRTLKGLAHCEEGVRRLRRGDKRVFQYNAEGEFVMAGCALSAWGTTMYRASVGDIRIDENSTPYWQEFDFARTQLSEAWGECSQKIIESQYIDDPAPNSYNPIMRGALRDMCFPADMMEIPDPEKHTLVTTDGIIPFSGIWEPVDLTKSDLHPLHGDQIPSAREISVAGTMNYLHGGSKAPLLRRVNNGKGERIPAVWRLLWRDDRYEDGTIPEEERGYVFQQPDPARLAPEPEELRGGMRVWSDEPCPYPGVWKCLDDLTLSPQTVAFGIPMPRLQGRRVMWRLMKAV